MELLFTVQKALPLFQDGDGGSIILIASVGGSKADPAMSVYGATKAAIRSFARTWTVELKHRKIRVNAISPEKINPKTAGPLFCGGITVFNPIIQNNIKPTDHVAVVGIGGLGHMAIKFLDSWGCEVTALSTNPEKEREAQECGADHFLKVMKDSMETSGHDMSLRALNSLSLSYSGFTRL